MVHKAPVSVSTSVTASAKAQMAQSENTEPLHDNTKARTGGEREEVDEDNTSQGLSSKVRAMTRRHDTS